jgi:hypothetical protein
MITKNRLLTQLAETETNLYQAQLKLAQHKQYFNTLANRHSIVLIGLILPSFLAGWRGGRRAKPGNKLQQFFKYLTYAAINGIRSK